ncbi:MAG: M90 family metallopeptidase [bacterium]
MQFSTILILVALTVLFWGVHRFTLIYRRNLLLQKALSPEQITFLEKNVPLYARAPKALRESLHGCINYFLDEKFFVGREGLVITDAIRLIVAANACLLIVNSRKRYFSEFKTIIIYPDTYVATETIYDKSLEVKQDSTRAGESWYRGPIVLSLGDVVRGSQNDTDGHNVVLHEFAHKLDEETGVMNGLPILRDGSHYKEWADVLTREYDEFLDRVDRGKNKVIDEYGAVSASEFFAVATESFFEKPDQMKKELPDLYEQLRTLFGLDPAEW